MGKFFTIWLGNLKRAPKKTPSEIAATNRNQFALQRIWHGGKALCTDYGLNSMCFLNLRQTNACLILNQTRDILATRVNRILGGRGIAAVADIFKLLKLKSRSTRAAFQKVSKRLKIVVLQRRILKRTQKIKTQSISPHIWNIYCGIKSKRGQATWIIFDSQWNASKPAFAVAELKGTAILI